MLKRIFALFLAMTMVFSMLPVSAFAADDEDVMETIEETEAPEEVTEPVTEPETVPEETEETVPEETEVPVETEEPEEIDPEEPEEEQQEDIRDAAVASGTCGDNLTWTLDTDGTLTISGKGAMYGYSSSSAPWKEYRSVINAVYLSDGVTSIGQYAFYDCNSLKSVTIGNGVTSIGSYAFCGCISLTSITIPDSVTYIGSSAFQNCSSLTCITIGNGVTSIGSYAFYGCDGLTSITIPDSVTSIGYGAFMYCSSLTTITIPDSVTSIGSSAFRDCTSLTSVTIGNGVTSIGDRAFDSCRSLTSVTIGSGVTSIGIDAFKDCSSLTSITIPDSVTTIGSYAFYECTSLTSVTIGNGVTTIGNGVTTIGYCAFRDCSSLTSVTIGNGVTSIGDMAFMYCSSLTSITIPDSVTTIGDYAFSDCTSLTRVTIGNGVTTFGESAFSDCTSLTSVTIGNGVATIGAWAFIECSSLTSITIPDSVTTIGDRAFAACDNLKEITVAESNKSYSSLGGVLFNKSKTQLIQFPGGKGGQYTIPDSVTTIGDSAFWDCSSLTSITIPDSVTTIGDSAFCDCSSLTSITIPDSVTTIGDSAFCDCSSLKSIMIPDSVTTIGDYAFSDCTSLTSISIPNSVTTIGYRAFYYCSSLTSVKIGKGVEYVGGAAFTWDTKLNTVTFTGDAPEFGLDWAYDEDTGGEFEVYPFYGVTAAVYYPCGNSTWTEEVRQDYSGKLTWILQHQGTGNVCDGCGKVLPENLVSISGPEMLKGGTSAAYKAKTSSKTTVLWKLRPQDMAFASVTSAGKLTTKAVAEPVAVELTAYLKSNPDISAVYSVTIVPAVEQVHMFCAMHPIVDGVIGLDIRRSETVQLNALIYPGTAMQSGTWKSSSAKIATVDANGLVKFLKTGTVTITFTASDGSKQKASVKIIAGTPVEGLTITGDNTVTSGGKINLTPAYSNIPTIKTFTWTSSDPTVAAVSAKGVVTAKTVYEATEVTITATVKDGSGVKAQKVITIQPKANVLPIWENGKIVNAKTICLDTSSGGTVLSAPKGSLWKSSAPSVAAVEDGVVTIKNTGTASITAVSADGKQTGKVTVKISTLVRRVEIAAPGSDYLISGKTKVTLKANVNADAKLKTLTWTSSDPNVASVTSAGAVTAKAGVKKNTKVTITATAKDGSGAHDEITLTVVPAALMVNIINETPVITADGISIAAGEVLNGRSIVLPVGVDFRLGAVVYPNQEDAAARQDVVWSFSAKGIVGSSSDGTMSGLKPGSVTITVKTADGKTNTVKIKFV